ncbi:MAG: 30S ribosomal protein S20 [Nitrospirae bacterium]|nr:30S ribosomal protein S20 [Nitrospirota bacterium]
MATHKSAEKRIRQTEKRRLRNKGVLSAMRTLIKKFQSAVEAKNPEGAKQALASVVPFVDKTASKRVIHKNKASRIVSRLTQKLNKLSATAAAPTETTKETKKPARAKKAPAKSTKAKKA